MFLFYFYFIIKVMFKINFKKIRKQIIKHKKRCLIILGILFVIVIGCGIGTHLYSKSHKSAEQQNQAQEKNTYTAFLSEIYEKIKENYWNEITDEQLSGLFKLAAEKLLNAPQTLQSADEQGMVKMADSAISNFDNEKKKAFSAQLANLVLVNLEPFGRSALYTQKLEQNLENQVKNVNPETNLYNMLGISKEASKEEIENAYQKKVKELEPQKDTSEDAKQQLEQIQYAYGVLSDQTNKEKYDSSGQEPTAIGKLIRPDILYLYIPRISPTSLTDLSRETDKFDSGDKLNALILDLRGNIGGSLDVLPYLLGPFIGPNNYAFELFKQGDYEPYKTQFGWLDTMVRYKKVVVLTDNNTQSSAEVMASTLKKYNVGVLVGATTKGWGTIEAVYPLDNQIDDAEKYSMFLVNHLTIRDDGKPIEKNGVEPTINISDKNWTKELFAYFNYQELVDAVKEAIDSEPGKI